MGEPGELFRQINQIMATNENQFVMMKDHGVTGEKLDLQVVMEDEEGLEKTEKEVTRLPIQM